MHQLGAVGDDVDSLGDQPVDNFPDALFVAEIVREENTTRSPGASWRPRVLVLGDARQGGAIPPDCRSPRQNPGARQAVEMVLPDKRWQFAEVAKLARDRDHPLHRAADHHDLAPIGEPRLRRRANARDVRGERRDDDAPRRMADQRGKVGRDSRFGWALPLAQHVGRIARPARERPPRRAP